MFKQFFAIAIMCTTAVATSIDTPPSKFKVKFIYDKDSITASPGLKKEEIYSVLDEHLLRSYFKYCLERYVWNLEKAPPLVTIRAKVTMNATGETQDVQIEASSLDDSEYKECVAIVFKKRVKFSPLKHSQNEWVVIPMRYTVLIAK